MAGRQFDSQNKGRPRWFVLLQNQQPMCFTTVTWTEYLDEAYRQVKDEPADRRAMARGQAPNYCEDCAGGKWRRSMEEQGRCQPLPISEQVDLPL